ncbi:hypothetical protein, partial [Pseudomonas aeruginosa]|uniref:hypothetical protein n=1 Tax=Pseudomonas aeruginosa TaxID=287 RepID=UPI001BAEEDD1
DNPLRKIFFFTSLAFYQPEIPDTRYFSPSLSQDENTQGSSPAHEAYPPRPLADEPVRRVHA